MSSTSGNIVTVLNSISAPAHVAGENKNQRDLLSVMTTHHEYEGKISVTGDLEKWRDIVGNSFSNFHIRELHINQFGYSVVTTEVANILVEFIGTRRVLDSGAGTGYVSSVLASMGVESVTAVDTTVGACTNKNWWKKDLHFPVQVEDTVKVLEQFPDSYDVILMSWPCYNTTTAYDVAKAMVSGQVLIYQGEGSGGCTGDDEFHEFLKEGFIEHSELNDKLWDNHYRFSGLYDRWIVYTKK